MQIGSLVICPKGSKGSTIDPSVKDVPPCEETIYTVEYIFEGIREDNNKKEIAIVLEEYNFNSMWGYSEKDFVEVQKPMDLQEMLKEKEQDKFIRKGKKLEPKLKELLCYD